MAATGFAWPHCGQGFVAASRSVRLAAALLTLCMASDAIRSIRLITHAVAESAIEGLMKFKPEALAETEQDATEFEVPAKIRVEEIVEEEEAPSGEGEARKKPRRRRPSKLSTKTD